MILSIILIFILSALISFIGSLQLGPVNLAVIQAASNKRYHRALWIGLGGALSELPYSTLALGSKNALARYQAYLNNMFYFTIPIFLIVGIYFIFIKKKSNWKTEAVISKTHPVLIGLSLGIFNPMILPFWVIVLQTYHSYGIMVHTNIYEEISFILAASTGAFGLQYALSYFIERYHEKFSAWLSVWVNPITGILFIIISIMQSIRFLIE